MSKIVYILGAGFSAPLGLPVMSSFLNVSKDLYFNDPKQFPHFKQVFNKIARMAASKNYYNTDLFNIEEILSLLEMEASLEGSKLKSTFISYIKDVIINTTPEMKDPSRPHNWSKFIFGGGNWTPYCYFVANLFNGYITRDTSPRSPYYSLNVTASDSKYSIITLNYDVLLEWSCQYLNQHYSANVNFATPDSNYSSAWQNPYLCKLHGCVTKGDIVPPTWNKAVDKTIKLAWKTAYQLLVEATNIRILGYSLPTSDAYVKYLLKAAVLNSEHLKEIDVICLDDDKSSVKERYDDFITYRFYRFRSASVTDYMNLLIPTNDSENPIRFDRLEKAHSSFMTNTKT